MMKSSSERLNWMRHMWIRAARASAADVMPALERVVQKVKRGLSRQKVCILSGVDDGGHSFARAYSCGSPSQDTTLRLSSNLG